MSSSTVLKYTKDTGIWEWTYSWSGRSNCTQGLHISLVRRHYTAVCSWSRSHIDQTLNHKSTPFHRFAQQRSGAHCTNPDSAQASSRQFGSRASQRPVAVGNYLPSLWEGHTASCRHGPDTPCPRNSQRKPPQVLGVLVVGWAMVESSFAATGCSLGSSGTCDRRRSATLVGPFFGPAVGLHFAQERVYIASGC